MQRQNRVDLEPLLDAATPMRSIANLLLVADARSGV
jgi:hypothetical protein